MKTKNLLILVLLCTTVFSSCKKDDNESTSINKSEIIGKWSVTAIYDYDENKWVDLTILGSDYIYAQFNSDNTYKSKWNKDYTNGTYSLIGDKIMCKVDGYNVYYKPLELNGNKATFEGSDDDGWKVQMKAIRQ